MPRRRRSAAAIVTHRQAGITSCHAASVGSGIVKKRIFVLVGLIAVGAVASANAQTGSYDAPLYGRGYVRPYGGPLVQAYEVATIVRAIGLEPLAPPIRRLTTYVMWATDQDGLRVRVIVDARYGQVLAVRPAVAWRRDPAGNRYSGSYNRRSDPALYRPSYRAAPRLDARVPLPRSRVAFAAPVPRPRPAGAGPSGEVPGAIAPEPVSLPMKPQSDRAIGAGDKTRNGINPPGSEAAKPATPPAVDEVAKAVTDNPAVAPTARALPSNERGMISAEGAAEATASGNTVSASSETGAVTGKAAEKSDDRAGPPSAAASAD